MKSVITTAAPEVVAAPKLDSKLVANLAAVYVIWSSTYLAIRIALVDLPPLLTASVRFVAAGLVLLAVAKRRGAAWPSLREWIAIIPIGGLLFLGGNGLVSIAEQSVVAGPGLSPGGGPQARKDRRARDRRRRLR